MRFLSPIHWMFFVAFMGDKAKLKGLEIIHKLHLAGISAQMDLMSRNVKGQFKYAARLSARYTVVIGDDEIDRGVVSSRIWMLMSRQK